MTDPTANALLADASARADILQLRLRGALEAMRTALAVMVVEPETSLARWRLKAQCILAAQALDAVKAGTLDGDRSERLGVGGAVNADSGTEREKRLAQCRAWRHRTGSAFGRVDPATTSHGQDAQTAANKPDSPALRQSPTDSTAAPHISGRVASGGPSNAPPEDLNGRTPGVWRDSRRDDRDSRGSA